MTNKEETEEYIIIVEIILISTDNKFRKENKIRLLTVFQTKIVTVCISATDVYQDVLKIPIFELEMNYY